MSVDLEGNCQAIRQGRLKAECRASSADTGQDAYAKVVQLLVSLKRVICCTKGVCTSQNEP